MGDMFQNSSSLPFYVHPMDQKRSLKIIKETKAEIKRMESRRPSTPLCTRNVQSGFFNELPLSSRPSSCSSIKSLKYEHEEHFNLSARTLSPIRSHKVGSAAIKLEPIVSKPVFFDRKNSASSSKYFKETFTVFPPLLCDKKGFHTLRSLSGSLEELQICPVSQKPLLKHDSTLLSDTSCDYIDEETKVFIDAKSDANTSTNSDDLNGSNKEQNLSNQLSEELNNVLPLLEKCVKLGSKKKEQEAISIVTNIFCLLEEKNAFLVIHDNRIPLLKVLFHLLDSNFPALSLHIVKLLLKMKIKEKNLCSIFRLISKLLKDQEIDLNEHDLIDLIMDSIYNLTAEANSEAVLYGIRILQTFITSQNVQKQQMENCLSVLFHQLRESNFTLSCRERGGGRCEEIVYMVMTLLRELVEDKFMMEIITSSENLTEIFKTLSCSQNSENIHLTVCFISKIVDDRDRCKAVAQCCHKDDLVALLSILETHRYSIDITLQTAFIIGNLVSVSDSTAQNFVWSSNFSNIFVVLGEYISEHIQFKETVSDCFKSKKFPTSSGDRNLHHEIFEVILKILCIFANICLHPNAGSYLAKHHGILSHLLAIIAALSERNGCAEAGITIYSFLVVVSNISYYLETDSEFSIKTAETIIPILDDCFSFEVRLEAANVIRNLTRSSEVRDYIQENSLIPAFINMLDEDDKAFCIAAYGIIMNLLIDENSRQIFYLKQGVTKVLHKLHLCADRDWKTCALLCQVLWNYFGGESCSIACVSKIEAQHLIKYLSYSLYNDAIIACEKDDSDYYQDWKNEFCPVAKKLFKLLQTKKAMASKSTHH